MHAIQYTIRNIPQPVDRYLRKRAKMSGKSLNQVVLDELSEIAGLGAKTTKDSLDWFYGSNTIDDAVFKALETEERIQKELFRDRRQTNDSY